MINQGFQHSERLYIYIWISGEMGWGNHAKGLSEGEPGKELVLIRYTIEKYNYCSIKLAMP